MGGEVQRNIDAQLKKPAQIIGLSECERATEDLLIGDQRTAAEGKDPAVAGAKQKESFAEREGHDYWTLRGNDETSNLLAVRSAVADGMELFM